MPRRSTKGPLGIGEVPLHNPLSSTPDVASSQLLSPGSATSTPRSRTPRLPSPVPGSTISSNNSFKTANSTLTANTSAMSQHQPTKDFSYLLRPEIYHPLTLLEVPPPFRVSSFQPTPETPLEKMVSGGHFRNAAIKSAQLLTAPGILPSDYSTIFSLLYTRLSCLTLCNQTPLASQEVKALEDLNSSYYRDDLTSTHLVPWELRVLAVRLQGMGFNDARRGIMGYYDLAREARSLLTSLKSHRRKIAEDGEAAMEGDSSINENIQMWESRLSDLGIRVASALVEMDDLEGAIRHLRTLKPAPGPEAVTLRMQTALLWLCLGDIESARESIAGDGPGSAADEESEGTISALAFMADGEYGEAAPLWERLIARPGDDGTGANGRGDRGERAMWRQNLGVCLLYLGRMEEARGVLEGLVDEGNSFHVLTFNISTIYELCTERSRALKIGLVEKVAGRDGTEDGIGWEKVNGDFKL